MNEILFETDKEQNIVIFGSQINGNYNFSITDDYSSFKLSKKDKIIKNSFAVDGFVSITNNIGDLINEINDMGHIAEVVDVYLIKKFKGKIELKVNTICYDEDDKEYKQKIDISKLNGDYILHNPIFDEFMEKYYDMDPGIIVNIDNEDVEIEKLTKDKIEQLIKVQERKDKIDNLNKNNCCSCSSCNDNNCDECDENCDCKNEEDKNEEQENLQDLIEKMEELQQEAIKNEKNYIYHVFEKNNQKVVAVVNKGYWNQNKKLEPDFKFNSLSELGINLRMVGIDDKQQIENSIFKIKDQDLTFEEIEENISKIESFEKDEDFSNFIENEDYNVEKEDNINTSNIDSIQAGNLNQIANIKDLKDDEKEEIEKNLSDKLVINGKKVDAKLDIDASQIRPVRYNEIKDLIKNEIETKFLLYVWEKDNGEEKIETEQYEGKKLISTNLDDDEVIIWLDTKTDKPFTIDFSKNPKGDIVSLKDEGETFTLLMEEKTTLIHVEEKMPESADLRTNEDFQKFLKKIKIYDQDRFIIDYLESEYSEEDLNHWITKMAEVGYIKSKSKYRHTGNDAKDYYFTVTNKFLRTRKFGFLDLFNIDEEIEEENNDEFFEVD